MPMTTEIAAIEREMTIAARPETVWEFLVDPAKAARWMGLGLTLDARPGGEYRCQVLPDDAARGEFVEVDPPRRLVWTWGWEPGGNATGRVPPGSSTIEIDLIPDGDGTLLRFAHRGLPTEDDRNRHVHGWDHYLERLATAGAGTDPGPDPWAV